MKYKMQMGLKALSVLLIIIILSFMPATQRLNLRTADGGIVSSFSTENGDYFDIQFRHSVNKGLITERYFLDTDTGKINLTSGWFESYGAGMMDTIDENMKMTEDGDSLRIDFPSNWIESVNFASAGIANHVFIYGENKLRLYELRPYKTINISIERTSFFEIMKSYIEFSN